MKRSLLTALVVAASIALPTVAFADDTTPSPEPVAVTYEAPAPEPTDTPCVTQDNGSTDTSCSRSVSLYQVDPQSDFYTCGPLDGTSNSTEPTPSATEAPAPSDSTDTNADPNADPMPAPIVCADGAPLMAYNSMAPMQGDMTMAEKKSTNPDETSVAVGFASVALLLAGAGGSWIFFRRRHAVPAAAAETEE